MPFFFFFSSRRRHTRCSRDWSSDVCSSDLYRAPDIMVRTSELVGVEAARLKIEALRARSEERRVGKECRSRWSPYHYKKNKGQTIKNHGDDDSDHRRGLTGARKRDHHLSFSAGDTDHLRPFFFSSRRRHTRFSRDWSSDVCSSDLTGRLQSRARGFVTGGPLGGAHAVIHDDQTGTDPEGVPMDDVLRPVEPAQPPPPAVEPVEPHRTGGIRRAVITAGISALLLVGGAAAAVSAASPDPSAAPSTTAPSNGGSSTTPPRHAGGSTANCPNMGGSSGSGSSGSGSSTAPSTTTPSTVPAQ